MTREDVLSIAYSVSSDGDVWWYDEAELFAFARVIAARFSATRPALTLEAVRQDFERQYKGHIGTTRVSGGRYLSPSIDDEWRAYLRRIIGPEPALEAERYAALLRQVLAAIESGEPFEHFDNAIAPAIREHLR
jgi:hypothetical protein